MIPKPHPELATALFAVLAIMLYGVVLARVVPKKQHFLWNILFTIGSALLGFIAGLSFTDIGFAGAHWQRTELVAGVTIVILAAVILVSRYVPIARTMLSRSPWADADGHEVRYAIWARIPFSTVLMEEVLFRGVIFGLLMQVWDTTAALVGSSLLFGVWHASPEAGKFEGLRFPALKQMGIREYIAIGITVIATFLAGLLFGWLRIWTGGLVAPWAVHWAINVAGIIAAVQARRGMPGSLRSQ